MGSRFCAWGVSVAAVALAVPFAPVRAQETDAGLPETRTAEEDAITVTGSRLSQPNLEMLRPSVIVTSDEIEARGFETVGQALNEEPAFGIPGASPIGSAQGGSFGSGQSFVNFLGLGDQRTLTLVNGRRFVSSNTASIFGPTNAGSQVDLNLINTKLVERVETIAIGGAPIYGSDAIAGTVNVILKRDFDGFELDGQYGLADRGDAQNYRMRAIGGVNFGDGRGNIVASVEYNEGRGLLYSDREATTLSRIYADCGPDSPFNQCLYDNRRIPALSEGGVLLVGGGLFGYDFPLSPTQQALLGIPGMSFGVQDAEGNQLQFDRQGNLIPIDFGSPVGGPTDFNIDSSGGNGFNPTTTQQLLTDTRRYNFNLIGSYDLAETTRLFGESWYSYSRGTNLRGQPVYNSGLFGRPGTTDGSILVSIDNPFLTSAQRAAIVQSINTNPLSDRNFLGLPQQYFYLGRANTDLYSGRASSATTLYRFVAGVEGEVDAGGRSLQWDVVGNYGRSETEGRETVVVQQNFLNAINAVRDGSGAIVCAPGYQNAPIATFSSVCAPLNLFGSGRASQEAIDYVTTLSDPRGENEMWDVVASVSGDIAALPGGALSFVLGYEHRDERTAFDPGNFHYGAEDPNSQIDTNGDGDPANDRVSYGRSVPILPVSGGFNTDELFGELRAEIINPSNAIPAVHGLELHAAARYVDHSAAGDDWTYTIEGRWAPIRDLAIRANYTRAIRAPAITELYNPSSQFFGSADDPCDADNLAAGPDPAARQANCAAAGIPDDFQSLSAQRAFSQAVVGNPDLENEKSKAWSIGTVIAPRRLPGFTATVDYLSITLKDAISGFTASQVASACYDSGAFPENEYCGLIKRGADHQLSFVETRYFNAAEYRYRGALGALSYRAATPFLGAESRMGIKLSYQYLRTLTTKADERSASASLDDSIGYPKHSAVLNATYDSGPLSLFTSFNYTGAVRQKPDEPEGFRAFQGIDDVVFVNAGLNVAVDDRMELRLVVDNVFDTKAPFPVPALGGAGTYFPGILGRYMRVGALIRL